MIAIVDYGMGNLRSVQKALQQAGAQAQVVTTASQLATAGKIVLPGVGAFADAIDRLRSHGLAEPLVKAAREGVPFLGICLGLQLMFDVSYEDGEYRGLGIFAGKVIRFDFDALPQTARQGLRIPHMGWNSLSWSRPCPLFAGLDNGTYAYFAHSYYVKPDDNGIACTTTDYGCPFTSSVWKDSVFGTQFHPEKSQSVGLRMLRNFVGL